MGRVLGIARFAFDAGGAEEFERLSERCLEIVRTRDTGTLRYDVYVNEDRSGAVVVEEYADQQALVDHGAHIGDELMAAVAATGEVRGEILGDLDDDFRASLAGGPVQAYARVLGLG